MLWKCFFVNLAPGNFSIIQYKDIAIRFFKEKFVPIFKENPNAVHLNFNTYLLNFIRVILFHGLPPSFTQLEYSIFPEPLRFFGEKFFNMIFHIDEKVKIFSITGIL